MAAASGKNGDIPFAIKSALVKFSQSAYLGRNVVANVVLPTPLGPAMTYKFMRLLSYRIATDCAPRETLTNGALVCQFEKGLRCVSPNMLISRRMICRRW